MIYLPLILFVYGAMNDDAREKYFAWASLVTFLYCLAGQQTVGVVMDQLSQVGGILFALVWLVSAGAFFLRHRLLVRSQKE